MRIIIFAVGSLLAAGCASNSSTPRETFSVSSEAGQTIQVPVDFAGPFVVADGYADSPSAVAGAAFCAAAAQTYLTQASSDKSASDLAFWQAVATAADADSADRIITQQLETYGDASDDSEDTSNIAEVNYLRSGCAVGIVQQRFIQKYVPDFSFADPEADNGG